MKKLGTILTIALLSISLITIGGNVGEGTTPGQNAKEKLRKGTVTRMKTRFNPKAGNYDYSALEMIAVIKDSENEKEYESEPLTDPVRSGKEVWFKLKDNNLAEIVDKRTVNGG